MKQTMHEQCLLNPRGSSHMKHTGILVENVGIASLRRPIWAWLTQFFNP